MRIAIATMLFVLSLGCALDAEDHSDFDLRSCAEATQPSDFAVLFDAQTDACVYNDDVTDRGIAWTDVEALEDEYGPVEHSGPDSVTFRVKSGGESCTLKECGTACGAFGCNGASVEGGGDTCQCSAC